MVRAVGALVLVATGAAVVLLVSTGSTGPAVAVGVAGAPLVALLAVVGRRSVGAQAGSTDSADKQRNIRATLRIAQGLAAVGITLIVAGGVMTLTGVGHDGLARTLLVWVGPHTLAAAAGTYSGYVSRRGELTRGASSG